MPRKSEMPSTPVPGARDQSAMLGAAASVPAAPPTGGWSPTEKQRLAKSKLLIEMRHDPLLDPSRLSNEQLGALMRVGEMTLSDWRKHPEFTAWLLTKRESEERAQFLLDSFLEQLGNRMPGMQDKDFVQAGKLLIDIVSRQTEAANASTDQSFEDMTPDQLRQLIARVAPQLLPPAAAAPQQKTGAQ